MLFFSCTCSCTWIKWEMIDTVILVLIIFLSHIVTWPVKMYFGFLVLSYFISFSLLIFTLLIYFVKQNFLHRDYVWTLTLACRTYIHGNWVTPYREEGSALSQRADVTRLLLGISCTKISIGHGNSTIQSQLLKPTRWVCCGLIESQPGKYITKV